MKLKSKDNKSPAAKEALSYSQSIILYLASSLPLFGNNISPSSCGESAPNQLLLGTIPVQTDSCTGKFKIFSMFHFIFSQFDF